MDTQEKSGGGSSVRRSKEARRKFCDCIAGMTDRFALDGYKKLWDPYEKV